jgi:hypothetical protein
MSDLEQLTSKLAELQAERVALANTRTKEDVRALAESWLAAACSRMNGTAGLVLNGHARPEQIQAVLAEFLLDSPALLDFIVDKVEPLAELTDKSKSAKLKKLDAEIAKAEQEYREVRKQAALEQIEAEFAA